MASVHRKVTLRVTSSYRTISEPAVKVITSVMPIDLRVQECKYVFDSKEDLGVEEAEHVAKVVSMLKWQVSWHADSHESWTKMFIGNITECMERQHGEVAFFLTQFLLGPVILGQDGKMGVATCVFWGCTSG
ncbi:uncharacterized protein LOC124371779 [Homalodisca vitripennis]|uniref:uncharacterized protein LOC124371779 n=1 Tax=Homalodisca vitripennis TaxID=197043 RepID=UPI001EEB18A9|nr:uncharacterized protein LOC124371779 [Homalodisca vitripennis]